MIQLGESLGFGAVVGGDLHRHQALHRPLPRQENLGEGAVPEFEEEIEIIDPVAGFEVAAADPRRGLGRRTGELLGTDGIRRRVHRRIEGGGGIAFRSSAHELVTPG